MSLVGNTRFLTSSNIQLIPPAGSKLFYNQQAFNLGLKSFQLDEFYRLFLIAGMTHCTGGLGSPNFGQDGTAVPSNPAASNVLDDIVNWVENGIAPDTIIGASDDGKSLRAHCRYPQRSVLDGTNFVCTTAENT